MQSFNKNEMACALCVDSVAPLISFAIHGFTVVVSRFRTHTRIQHIPVSCAHPIGNNFCQFTIRTIISVEIVCHCVQSAIANARRYAFFDIEMHIIRSPLAFLWWHRLSPSLSPSFPRTHWPSSIRHCVCYIVKIDCFASIGFLLLPSLQWFVDKNSIHLYRCNDNDDDGYDDDDDDADERRWKRRHSVISAVQQQQFSVHLARSIV